ncbi:MAG: hypothetical protein DCC88_00400 [Spirobacillus cienkowskii]|uniref:Uncharacterized protein n=1 Tax=Spirobacillus cienkowskii TaxID=495820 RepID=A0A369KS05_9BACT|nr:MAG: hypothetical protein DCC88_00400 [Spirobacillus cienkowskii]
MSAEVFPSYCRLATNFSFTTEETESVNLQNFSLDYSNVHFIINVNGVYEKIKRFNRSESGIFFETDSLIITPDITKPTSNILIKNKTRNTISYSITVVPWQDIYENEVKEIKEKIDKVSLNLSKIFPLLEFTPSDSVTTFNHNLDFSVSNITVKIFDFSEKPIIKNPVFGKFVGGIFQYENIFISHNNLNPKNAIDIKFNSSLKPSYCITKLEGRSLILELLDSQNKNFNYSNRKLEQGKKDSIKHNINADITILPVHIKTEYTVNGKLTFIPANKKRVLRFNKIGTTSVLNLINQDLLADNGNIVLYVKSDKNEIEIDNNINLLENNFNSVGYSIDINEVFIGLTLYIELAQFETK